MAAKTNLKWLIGLCRARETKSMVRLSVITQEFDERLMMFFPKRRTFYAHDPKQTSKPGDVILIKKLPQPLTQKIYHEVSEVVFSDGHIIDPVTGKQTYGTEYMEDVERRSKLFGKPYTGFYAYQQSKQLEQGKLSSESEEKKDNKK